MVKQIINIGSTANDGTGSTIRAGGDIVNDNFTEVYSTLGDGSTITFDLSGASNGQALVYNSSTGKFNPGTASVSSTFTIAGDGGVNQTITTSDTLTMQGGTGITTTGVDTDVFSVAIDNTVATLTGSQVLTGKTINGPDNTLTNIATSSLTGTITNTQLAGSIANAKLSYSSITIRDDTSTEDVVNLGETLIVAGAGGLTTGVSGNTLTLTLPDDAVTTDKLANSINSAITANTAKTGISTGQASAITANTAKVTNATHSGEVTGATALTIADNIVDEANLKVSNSPTNGYFLSAQSGNTGGLTWAEAGGGAFELISTTNVNSATSSVDFNTLSSDYTDFRVIVSSLKNAAHQSTFQMRVKRAGQSGFDSGGSDYLHVTFGRNGQDEIKVNNSTGQGYIDLMPPNLAATATVGGAAYYGIVDIFDVHATNCKKTIGCEAYYHEGTYGRAAASKTMGYRNSQEALIGLQFRMNSGNIVDGYFSLYGRKI